MSPLTQHNSLACEPQPNIGTHQEIMMQGDTCFLVMLMLARPYKFFGALEMSFLENRSGGLNCFFSRFRIQLCEPIKMHYFRS